MSFNTTLMISIVIVSLMGFSFIFLSTNIASNYNVVVPEKYHDSFNKFSQAADEYETFSDIIEGGDIDPEGQDQAVFKNTIIAGRQAMSVASIASQLLNDLISILKIHITVYSMIALIVIILSVSGFVYLLTGRRP